MPFWHVLEEVREFTNKKYPNELIKKTIAILQNLEQYGAVWNITFVTHSLNIINTKAGAKDGKILSDKIESIMNLIKK